MITELAPTKTMNNLIIEFKVDLTQDHDVLGAYHSIDFSEIRAKYRAVSYTHLTLPTKA